MIFGVPAMGYPQTRLDGKYLSVLKRLKDCAWKIYLDYFFGTPSDWALQDSTGTCGRSSAFVNSVFSGIGFVALSALPTPPCQDTVAIFASSDPASHASRSRMAASRKGVFCPAVWLEHAVDSKRLVGSRQSDTDRPDDRGFPNRSPEEARKSGASNSVCHAPTGGRPPKRPVTGSDPVGAARDLDQNLDFSLLLDAEYTFVPLDLVGWPHGFERIVR